MKLTIKIDEKELHNAIIEFLLDKLDFEFTQESFIKRQTISDAVKEVIARREDEIIDRCVKRASKELTKELAKRKDTMPITQENKESETESSFKLP